MQDIRKFVEICLGEIALVCLLATIGNAQDHSPIGDASYPLCYVHHARAYSDVPPIDGDMPPDIVRTYLKWDSICKYTWPRDQRYFMNMIHESLSESDTWQALKELFVVGNHDPERLMVYKKYAREFDTSYTIKPAALIRAYKSKCMKTFGGASNPALYIAFVDGAFFVEITEVHEDSVRDSGGMGTRGQEVVCITAKVLKCIRGAPLAETCSSPEGDAYKCVRFSYAKDWLIHGGSDMGSETDVGIRHPYIDSGSKDMAPDILYARYGNMPVPQPGERYIVFLEMQPRYGDDAAGVPYNLILSKRWERRGGIFLVRDGTMWDPQQYFGLGKQVVIGEFLPHINKLIQEDILRNPQ